MLPNCGCKKCKHFQFYFVLLYFRFEAMLKWAKHRVNTKTYSNRVDAKIEFRCCMDRLTRDLKLYRIAPQDLIKVHIYFHWIIPKINYYDSLKLYLCFHY